MMVRAQGAANSGRTIGAACGSPFLFRGGYARRMTASNRLLVHAGQQKAAGGAWALPRLKGLDCDRRIPVCGAL